MNRWLPLVLRIAFLPGCFLASEAAAQSQAPQSAPLQSQTPEPVTGSRLWLTAGTAFVTVRGQCQTCEEEFPYRHGASVLANVGYRVNNRMNAGAEFFWVPMEGADGDIRATHVDAIAEFRPWSSHGFFLKGGAGMAFVRNWVDAVGPDAINQKALSVVIGTGWTLLRDRRVGLQVVAAQHVAALGDLQTADSTVPDVIGNFWSIGATIVIR